MNWLTRIFRKNRTDGPGDVAGLGDMLSCLEVGEQLQQFLDAEIDDATALRINEHLEACRRCGLESDTYRRIKATLAARRQDVPPETAERLREFGRQLVERGSPPVNR